VKEAALLEAITFWILAAGTTLSAAAVVLPPFGRNPIHAALALVSTLFFLAGLFVMLSATFLAAMQILVYAGAIMVLFIFVIMLLNLRSNELGEARITGIKVATALAGLLLVGKLVKVALTSGHGPSATVTFQGPDEFGAIGPVGELLFKQFLLPFEMTSVLLLVAVIAAVAIARRRFGRGVE
jgi:NADH-quinone oxidoreductase subunit J